jgi:DNA-directed RNA polymerase specialized sigma24 family protein
MKDEVTSILLAIEPGDPRAAERLLPLVYDELRRLAAQRLAQEKPGQTLQPTALVHFTGLTLKQAAECLVIAPRTADCAWRYARALLYAAMDGPDSGEK